MGDKNATYLCSKVISTLRHCKKATKIEKFARVKTSGRFFSTLRGLFRKPELYHLKWQNPNFIILFLFLIFRLWSADAYCHEYLHWKFGNGILNVKVQVFWKRPQKFEKIFHLFWQYWINVKTSFCLQKYRDIIPKQRPKISSRRLEKVFKMA